MVFRQGVAIVVSPKFVEELAWLTADPSTPFAAKYAANSAQDDNSFLMRTSGTGHYPGRDCDLDSE